MVSSVILTEYGVDRMYRMASETSAELKDNLDSSTSLFFSCSVETVPGLML